MQFFLFLCYNIFMVRSEELMRGSTNYLEVISILDATYSLTTRLGDIDPIEAEKCFHDLLGLFEPTSNMYTSVRSDTTVGWIRGDVIYGNANLRKDFRAGTALIGPPATLTPDGIKLHSGIGAGLWLLKKYD